MTDEPTQLGEDPAETPAAQAEGATPWWRRRWVIITAAVVLALIVIGALASGNDDNGVGSSTDSAAPSATVEESTDPSATETVEAPAATPTSEPTATPDPTPEVAGFGSGTVVVGTDVEPGTYRGEGGTTCYWERLSGFGGTLDEVIVNDLGNVHPIVTISESDAGFNSEDCGSWTADVSAITEEPTAVFSDGTYQVGVDVSPGTWRSTGGDTCYWERLSGFSGTLDDVIANDLGGTDPIVTIDAADVGFGAQSCGDWTYVGG